MMTPKPSALAPKPETIPAELISYRSWVRWRYEWRGGKWTKVPYRTDDRRRAKPNDPSTWGRFDRALAGYSPGFDGVGFMLSKEYGIIGVDLDHCIGQTTKSWALAIMFELDSYSELSPSCTGLRILLKGCLPPNGRKKNNIEMYESRRFLTITGNHRAGSPLTIEARQQQIEALHKRVFTKTEAVRPRNNNTSPNLSLNDSELLEKMFRAKNGAAIQALFGGDTCGRGRSEADMAFCRYVSCYSKNPDQIDRLFRRSGLMRDKWDERHFADGRTYGEATISKVLERL